MDSMTGFLAAKNLESMKTFQDDYWSEDELVEAADRGTEIINRWPFNTRYSAGSTSSVQPVAMNIDNAAMTALVAGGSVVIGSVPRHGKSRVRASSVRKRVLGETFIEPCRVVNYFTPLAFNAFQFSSMSGCLAEPYNSSIATLIDVGALVEVTNPFSEIVKYQAVSDWRLELADELRLAKEEAANSAENGVPPSLAFDDAIRLLENDTFPADVKSRPTIAFSGDEELGLIWDSSDRKKSITIWFEGNGKLYWSLIKPPPERVREYEEDISDVRRQLIVEILSLDDPA